MVASRLGALELDLDVFAGPFDLLCSLILREELDLLEVDLADVVLAYLEVTSPRGGACDSGRAKPDPRGGACDSGRAKPDPRGGACDSGRAKPDPRGGACDSGRAKPDPRGGACDPGRAKPHLDLEAATEFLALIAALLELKSRLMLPGEEIKDLDEPAPAEAADELLARMLAYLRHRGAAGWLAERLEAVQGSLHRRAPLPAGLRQASLANAEAVYAAVALGGALGGLLRTPAPIDLAHLADPRVALPERLAVLRGLLRRGRFSFDEAVRGSDRMTVAVTVFALLELYKGGEAAWEQSEPFGPITVTAAAASAGPARVEAAS